MKRDQMNKKQNIQITQKIEAINRELINGALIKLGK